MGRDHVNGQPLDPDNPHVTAPGRPTDLVTALEQPTDLVAAAGRPTDLVVATGRTTGLAVAVAAPGPTSDPVSPALLRCGQEGFSGLVRAGGDPGGTIWFRAGAVVAATTPASPDAESLLLRSGRVSEADWARAYAAGAGDGRLAAELTGRGAVGVAGLEAVCLSAVFDAVFAMTLFGVDGCVAEPAVPGELLPPLALPTGVGAERLARETARRLASAAAWRELGVTARSRPLATPPAHPPLFPADEVRHAVLLKANGRRTARDIAFTLGRGLFAVMGEIARMAEEGVIEVSAPAAPPTGPPVREDAGTPSTALPQRRPGTSKVNEVLPTTSASRFSVPRRLLGLRDIRSPAPGEED
ncbi:hypothetical protein [Sphaerisporangium corydalis]|uniref:MarR family transcriptional regulator n=1 Tax=Sphaerisporangium corydalis TaxID=1441875 RepID=A0ABV9E961_9ACTN|nr:hypothetical protein [Sphaerisporangium corydalis]